MLPRDGLARLFKDFVSPEEARTHFDDLYKNTPWESDEIRMYGKLILTKRQVALYGDEDLIYGYSGNKKQTIRWTASLLSIKERVESAMQSDFNVCLLNLYQNGKVGMAWHADDEKELGLQPVIASLTLGCDRVFVFKHKQTGEQVKLLLPEGSLLEMSGDCQKYWVHSLPKMSQITAPRINLTFRKVIS